MITQIAGLVQKLYNSSHMVSADYNDKTYDYTKYWVGRDYENASEFIALEKLLPSGQTSLSVIDVGGGFGRLLPVLSNHFKNITVFDYSQSLLDTAQQNAQKASLEITTTKGDIYQLSSIATKYDYAVMMRVSHHLEHLDQALSEVYKVLNPGGFFIVEIANKMHIKSVLINALKFNFNYFNQSPVSRASKDTAFLNYHPKACEQMFLKTGFKIEAKLSVSNLRSPLLKSVLPEKVLLSIENASQKLLSPLNFGPSIIYRLSK